MPEQSVGLMSLVKNSVLTTQKTVYEISNAIAGVVNTNLTHAIGEAEKTRVAVFEVVQGAMEGACETGADFEDASKATIMGVARSVQQAGGDAFEAIRTAAHAIIRITADLHGDITKAAMGAVQGAAAAAKDLGRELTESFDAVATAVVEAAEKIDKKAAEQATEAVKTARRHLQSEAARAGGRSKKTQAS